VIAIYIFLCAVISVAATAFLPDYTNRDISQERDASGLLGRTAEGSP